MGEKILHNWPKFGILHFILITACLLSVNTIFAQDDEESAGITLKPSGYFIFDAGYIKEGVDAIWKKYQSEPFVNMIGGVVFDNDPEEAFYLKMNMEVKTFTPFPRKEGESSGDRITRFRNSAYVEEAKGLNRFGDLDNPIFEIEWGYFVHQHNPETRNFGNYLFRSKMYPSLVYTTFNYPKAQLMGLRFGTNFGGFFNANVFTVFEPGHYPEYDLSLAGTMEFKYNNLFSLGVGVNWRSFIQPRPSKTTPTGENRFFEITNVILPPSAIRPANADSSWVPVYDSTNLVEYVVIDDTTINTFIDRVPLLDTVFNLDAAPNGYTYTDANGLNQVRGPADPNVDTPVLGKEFRYTYEGQIMDFRAMLNPLSMMEESPLGQNAFKVYLEYGIIGWKDYPGFYENRAERSPLTFGLYLPTFNLLDVLAFEMEHYPSKIVPTYAHQAKKGNPHPGGSLGGNDDGLNVERDDLKWIMYVKKNLPWFSIVAQIGTDHTRLFNGDDEARQEVFTNPSQWYFQARISTAVGK